MFKEKIQSILKNICGALVLPVLMYVVMMIFCFQNGKMYYGSVAMWRSLISTIAASATCAYGIGIQFKSGFFSRIGNAVKCNYCRQCISDVWK